jgi:hypothetical protein
MICFGRHGISGVGHHQLVTNDRFRVGFGIILLIGAT